MTGVPGTRALTDAAARRSAATLFDRNLVVVAGAGTGKTALLVERALNLVAGRGIAMREIAAITFTEKAAAELRQRLARALDELRVLARDAAAIDDPAPSTEARRAYAWLRGEAGLEAPVIEARALAALVDLDGAPVSTLHAFCADILRRHPREAGVDPGFAVDDGPLFRRIFDESRESFLSDELGPGAPRPDLWREVLSATGGLEAVADVGEGLASFRLPDEAAAPPPAGTARELVADEIEAVLAEIASVRERARGLNRNMETHLDLGALYLRAFLDGGRDAMTAAAGAWPLADYLAKGVPAPGKNLEGCAQDEVQAAAARGKALVSALAASDEERIAALVVAAAPLARQTRERLLQAGFVSFDALLRLTRDLLARDLAARRREGSRHRALLVDEFQDNDPLQYEILFFLADDPADVTGDAYRTRLAPARLFIVGDPQQSIYRFRGADIEAYRRAVDHIVECGGEILALDNSFRSPEAIVGPINTLFGALIGGRETNEQPAYRAIVSARGPAAGRAPRVEIWSVQARGTAEDRRDAEAEAIASWIAAQRGGLEATGRPLACRDVALLFRALTDVHRYARALRRAGLPFVVEGGSTFFERPEVEDLISFLRAAANRNDRAAALAVLRGPLGGVPDAEMARFVSGGGRLDGARPSDVDPAVFPGLSRTLRLIEDFRDGMRGRAPDEIVRAALRSTSLLVLHAAQFEGAQRVANLRKLVSRAEELARGGLSLEESLRALEEEIEEPRDEDESPLADETVDAVRVLSVHKAKGLEFDVVFVPDVGRDQRPDRGRRTEIAWLAHDGGHAAVRLRDGTSNVAWVRHERRTRRHEDAEEKRVFYVACTRARERLVLVNSSETRRAPWRDALSALGYTTTSGLPPDGTLDAGRVAHHLVSPGPVSAPAPSPPLDDRWLLAARRFAEAAASAAAGARSPLRSPARASEEDRPPAPPGRPAAARTTGADRRGDAARRLTARLAGAAAHAALRRWDFVDDAGLYDLARESAARIVEEEPPGRARRDLRHLVEIETAGILGAFVRSPLPARLRDWTILGREVPILFRDGDGAVWSGSCDLVCRDRDGGIVVADYKTERPDPDPVAAAERHRRQVEIYLEAFRRALPGTRCRGEILFVRGGVSVAL